MGEANLSVIIALLTLVGGLSYDQHVQQFPSHITAETGNAVTMNCIYNSTEGTQRVRMAFKRLAKQPNEIIFSINNNTTIHHSYLKKVTYKKKDSFLEMTILNVEEDDSDIYVCEVNFEIPLLKQMKGGGTNLTIKDSFNYTAVNDDRISNPSHGKGNDFIGGITATAVLLIICLLLAVYCFSRSRKRQTKDSPVYVNMISLKGKQATNQSTCQEYEDHLYSR
ncbi:uncharacterized protein LOC122817548 [Protopterus annectens]|uniref:uncharacterized protein LOC122817548 n=1 Tax=Protopterus annectens TaxID=7888 RepID=UPI001CF9F0BA|nr:uncharacterized protein LOC122817548 [Protopterus annectens]